MRRASLTLAAAVIAGLALATASVAAPRARTVPDALVVPDGQRVVLKTIGVGVQVYDCVDGSWRFRAALQPIVWTRPRPSGASTAAIRSK